LEFQQTPRFSGNHLSRLCSL